MAAPYRDSGVMMLIGRIILMSIGILVSRAQGKFEFCSSAVLAKCTSIVFENGFMAALFYRESGVMMMVTGSYLLPSIDSYPLLY